MTRDDAKGDIIDLLSDLQMRTQGFADFKGEINLDDLADQILEIAQRVQP